MDCVAYMRVSTEKQAEEGNGLESQKRDIENYARKNELIITDWYVDDGYTGSNMDRPQLQRLIRDCDKHRIKCVIAFKLDRISRNMIDGLYMIERVFQKNEVSFQCVHDSVGYDDPMQQAYTQMMAVFAQLDKNTMMLRMRGGMLERVKQGHWMGGGNLPYCYSYNEQSGVLEPIPERAERAKRAMTMYLDGYTDERITVLLGFKHERTVHQVLTSVVNIGMIPYKGEVYQGLHEPIFDRETFETAQRVRQQRSRLHEWKRNTNNLLTGLCYCGVCGCKMRYQQWGEKGKFKIYCYSNIANKSYLPNWNPDCDNDKVWAQDVEKAVVDKVLKISCDLSSAKKPEQQSRYDILVDNLDKERSKLKRLYALYADGNDTVISMIRDQESTVKQLEAEVREESKVKTNVQKNDIVYDSIKSLADIWDRIDNAKRGNILRLIINKIVITHGKIDIHLNSFYPTETP